MRLLYSFQLFSCGRGTAAPVFRSVPFPVVPAQHDRMRLLSSVQFVFLSSLHNRRTCPRPLSKHCPTYCPRPCPKPCSLTHALDEALPQALHRACPTSCPRHRPKPNPRPCPIMLIMLHGYSREYCSSLPSSSFSCGPCTSGPNVAPVLLSVRFPAVAGMRVLSSVQFVSLWSLHSMTECGSCPPFSSFSCRRRTSPGPA
jgi:hypothetical protein